MIEIKVGQKWRKNNGSVVTIVSTTEDEGLDTDDQPVLCDQGWYYTRDGKCLGAEELVDESLVERVTPSGAISHIHQWFEQAVPNPTDKNRAVQLGVHIEEVAEMFDALFSHNPDLVRIANRYKQSFEIGHSGVDKRALLDSLCDQIVTAVGVARMFDMDIEGALAEVDRSNWSKFVDGKPVFNEHGKIAKGPNYTPPNLTAFISSDN